MMSNIKVGTFDELGKNRSTLLASFENIVDIIELSNKKGFEGQVSMFDLGENEEEKEKIKYSFDERPEMSEKELLSTEKEMLGIYISGHPLEKIKEQILSQITITSSDMREIDDENLSGSLEESNIGTQITEKNKYIDGQNVKIAGIITSVKKKITKSNKLMAFITLEDLYGTIEIIAFENVYMSAQNNLIEENVVLIEGRLSIREDEATKIVASKIINFEDKKTKTLHLNITTLSDVQKDKLRGAIKFFNGERNNIPVVIEIGKEIKSCGQIYCTEEILKVFEEIDRERKRISMTMILD